MKAILFDLDETLLNRSQSLEYFIHDQYTRLFSSYQLEEEDFCSRFIEWDQRGYVWKDIVYERLIAHYSLDHFQVNDLVEDYLVNFGRHAKGFEGVDSVLSTLKKEGFVLGLITNGREDLQSSSIKALQIEQYFDIMVISESIGMKKPDPRIFHHALSQLGVDPENAVYIGDHPVNDVEAAQKAGMHAIWKRTSHWDGKGIQHVIDDLSEILTYLSLKV
ncbi:HAD family hydrolase [Rossellomorea aquimaris]|uniref:HAD family hydrolase n=1 Tax=Rossellomorea aquimaris TaxID=189382 RepID=UPI001CD1BD1B|nr:HAD family hydrolase [Rossellomorea aquimaris]MCA1053967.1 HAD family hydrolase [Rossellomorea aquimaris]